ncbi:MAG: Crp/Fnr family transcriptional regulator [Chitinophagaceae bacterium]|nr:Crp/Fnr family transcriptional regulator [Chitinophagaceae bacterium]
MKRSKKNCDLQSCSFCKLCLREWSPAIDVNRQTLLVSKGEEFITEGEKVTGVYFVYEGAVKVHKKWGEKELIVRFAKRGDIVGHRGLGNDIYYPVSATALEPSTVCFIPIDFFLASLKVNQEYLFQLMLFFADELKVSERKMRNLAHMPVKGRVAQALLTLSDKFGTAEDGLIDLTLSRQDLASYTGATYETVFRVLNELVEEGLVKLSGKHIGILDIDKLTSVTDQPG